MANTFKTGSPIVIGSLASDPGTAENGMMYYNSTTGKFRVYQNATWGDASSSALAQYNVFVGNSSSVPTAVNSNSVGNILADSTNGLTIKSSVIADSMVSATAAIALSKLAALTVSRALQSNASTGAIEVSSVTNTELGYLSGVTSAIQTQFSNKLSLSGGTMSGAIAMGANKITGLASGTASGDALQWGQIGAANGVAGLDSGGKVPYSQLPSALMTFKGAWSASANTPTLADGTGTAGDVYRASTAGTQNLGSGAQTWAIGDFVIYNGSIWQHSPAADGVSSVNGNIGSVTVNAINQLSGDVTTSAASGSQSLASSLVATSNATLATLSALTSASSLATVGTITTGTWNATTIAIAHGGTNNTTFTSGSITYFDGTKIAEDNANLFYDATNKRIGLGTTTPGRQLEILGTSAGSGDGINIKNYNSNAASIPSLGMSKARGTTGTPTAVQSGDFLFGAYGNGHNGTAFQTTAPARLVSYATETFTTTAAGSAWLFYTTPNTTLTIKARIGIGQDGALNLYGNTSGTMSILPAAAVTTYSVTLPAAQGTGALTNDGSGNLSWSTTSGANAALSNLASVAINTSLLPGTDVAIDVGSAAKRFTNAFATVLDSGSSDLTLKANGGSNNLQVISAAVKRGANSSRFINELYVDSITLTGSQSGVAVSNFTVAFATIDALEITYRIKDGTSNAIRIGTLRAVTDGTNTSIVDTYTETADAGVSWTAAINGSNLEIRVTTTANVKTMRADIKQFLL